MSRPRKKSKSPSVDCFLGIGIGSIGCAVALVFIKWRRGTLKNDKKNGKNLSAKQKNIKTEAASKAQTSSGWRH